MPEVKMPQLGESVVEGTITKWLKSEGDEVAEDDLLLEISTDKVDSEVPSSFSGKLTKILVQEGETVSVGTPIAVIGEDGASGGDASAESKEESKGETEEAPQAEDQAEPEPQEEPEAEDEETSPPPAADKKEQPKAEEPAQEEKKPARAAAARKEGATARTDAAVSGDTSKRGIISPLVRRLADENDVDLDEVQGTGTGGRIRKQDVLKFIETRKSGRAEESEQPAEAKETPARREAPAEKPAPAKEEARPAAAAGEREEIVPWSNIRRRTAEHMVAAHLESARAWNAVEADWTAIVELREAAKARFKEREGFNLTYMPFLARAVCETLLEMPEVNATFDEENQSNILKHYVNLGIAVALEGGGLIVPVVKGADEKNLVGLARGINDVAQRARTKKLSPDDLVGGTFTITNPGPFGSIMSVPIIPRGQTAILAFEAIQKRVVVTKDDAIAIRSMGFLPMSWDHRTIDGAEAAKFLASLRERIETTDFSSELSQYLD